jgi:hypothetical protein
LPSVEAGPSEDGDDVPGVRDWLDRFRPAGAPGAATATAVPVDRRRVAAAELEPVFAALAGDIERAATLRDAMINDAARRRAEGRESARAVLASAQTSATAERTAEESRLRRLATAQTQLRQQQAAIQAQAVRTRAAQRRAALVGDVLDRVRAEIEELGSRAGPGSEP